MTYHQSNWISSLLAVFLLSACSSENTPQTPVGDNQIIISELQKALTTHVWTLTHTETDDGQTTQLNDESGVALTLQLANRIASDGTVTQTIVGRFNCNGYSGYYTLEDKILTLSNLIATEIACEAAEVSPSQLIERIFFKENATFMLSLHVDKLELLSGSNVKLIFVNEPSIEFDELVTGDLAFTANLTFDQPRFQVIKSNEQLNELYFGSLTESSCNTCGYEPLHVNFNEYTVVLIAHEIVSSGGYSIFIESVMERNNRLSINVVKTTPGSNCAVSTAFTGPYILYRLKGIYDDIDFIERTVQNPNC